MASRGGSFALEDPMPYTTAGIRSIVDDCVSSAFTSEELNTWNMLTR